MKKLNILVLIVQCLILFNLNSIESWKLELYEHAHHRGAKLEVDVGQSHNGRFGRGSAWRYECHKLPRDWWDRVSSLNTHGNCVRLYSREDCTSRGTPIVFYRHGAYPDNIPHYNFGGTWFNDNARSYRGC